jgi:hypothetical protein
VRPETTSGLAGRAVAVEVGALPLAHHVAFVDDDHGDDLRRRRDARCSTG